MTNSNESNPDDLERDRLIDSICDRFEQDSLEGKRPQIEHYLAEVHGALKQVLLVELVAIELHYRRKSGEAIAFADYQSRFPGLSLDKLMRSVDKSLQRRPTVDLIPQPADIPTIDTGGSQPKDSQSSFRNTTIGDYRILEPIAQGGMGVVYKARQISLNRIVALKMILSGELASKEEIDRFYLEARSAALLNHPGIVPIYEVGEHEGKHYFSMAFVEGTSLAMKLGEGPLEPKVAAQTIMEICDAIQYAHEKGIIHRDLKPSNILLDCNGRPRVADFGLAKQLAEPTGATVSGQVLGTPNYMPPEQASGRISVVGPAADVYALGAILYSLTTGHPPFQGASSVDTLRQVIEKEPRAPRQVNPSLPRDLETIILKCLEKSLPRRYSSASELANELRCFLEGLPILARPLSRVGKTLRLCRRNPITAVLTSIVGLMMFAVACVTIWLTVEVQQIRRQRPVLLAFQNLGGEFIFASAAPVEGLEDVFNYELFLVGVDLIFSENNDVTDAGLTRLHELSQLQGLSLSNTSVTDAALIHVGKMKQLKRLNLSGTQITDAGMSHLAHLTKLEELNLAGTKITIDGLVQIRGLSKLVRLDVTDTQIKHEDVVKLYGPRGPRFFIRY